VFFILEFFGVKFLAIFPDILAFSFVEFTPKISKFPILFQFLNLFSSGKNSPKKNSLF
jgi:hypothetical protein